MNESIKFWIEYAGGMDIVWLLVLVLAGTQVLKILLSLIKVRNKKIISLLPYLVGGSGALVLIDVSVRAALIGVCCSMIASLAYFVSSLWLNRKRAPAWQKKIAKKMGCK